MLIRILGEGQFVVPDSELEEINRLDRDLERALTSTGYNFQQALDALLDKVRTVGSRPPEHEYEESQVILPFADASEDDVRDMLSEDGLVPGL